MVPVSPVLQVHEAASVAVNQFAMAILRHEIERRARGDVGGLVVTFAQGGDDCFGHDAGLGPRGCDGVEADGEFGMEVCVQSAEKAEDAVFGDCWDRKRD